MNDIFSVITEARIREAMVRGDFDDLPGAGKPLIMQDLSFFPPELRVAFIILKNSGFLDFDDQVPKQNITTDTESIPFPNANQENAKETLSEKSFRFNVMLDSRRRF